MTDFEDFLSTRVNISDLNLTLIKRLYGPDSPQTLKAEEGLKDAQFVLETYRRLK